jgi:hypothetical protein
MEYIFTANGHKTVECSTFYDIWKLLCFFQLGYPRNIIKNEVSLMEIKSILNLGNSYFQSVKNVSYLHQNLKT